jgi:hypothetical protein
LPYNFPASGFPRKVWTHWHAAFVRNKTGEDLTSLSSTSPERTMSHWPPIEEHLWWTVITSTISRLLLEQHWNR